MASAGEARQAALRRLASPSRSKLSDALSLGAVGGAAPPGLGNQGNRREPTAYTRPGPRQRNDVGDQTTVYEDGSRAKGNVVPARRGNMRRRV